MRSKSENVLEVRIGRLLKDQKLTLAVAESCTGGLIGHRITNVPGSSAYYQGSITAYASEVKEHILHVRRSTLQSWGAVSEETALEMAQGVREAFHADVGLAVTGIAGPGGGTSEKPVGLVYVALVAPGADWVERHVWEGDRWENKADSAEAALELLHIYLDEHLDERKAGSEERI